MSRATPPAPAPSPSPLPIFTLLCHRHVEWALCCLRSLHAHLRDPFVHSLQDDGTLTDEDRARLREALGDVSILCREELDDRVAPALRDKPNCRAYRERQAFALKLIDSALLADGAFAQCDGDILFLRPAEGLDRRGLGGGEGFVFMKDNHTAYSVSYRNRHFGKGRIRLPQFVNAGFMYAGPGAYDLDFIEWFLGQDRYLSPTWVVEQTAWAALAGRRPSRYFAPDQVAFPVPSRRPDPARCVALHFAGKTRARLDDRGFLEQLERDARPYQGEVARLETVPTHFVGPVKDFCGRVYGRLSPKET
ncbi:hypothetical protein OJF2_40900 [Aquisphaera giovannonii]|uniref:Nucleotide-diphospho-sugar transferase domain-containing protein n=1 Tax=Aquisphaera giovannonii TaxID=406548 RepID=A0A5B9W4U6_9BACT|nr:hypothetical protein [Aquisphaera giovannonii]QEH35538.1 hypothetical protein OJF2_40900 [Aquisphaera giovannonii]